jgi:hypothetical protein
MPGQARRLSSSIPIEGLKGTMSINGIMASIIATSTRRPRPVSRRPWSAARVPIAAKSALPMSPSAPATPMLGSRPGSGRNE